MRPLVDTLGVVTVLGIVGCAEPVKQPDTSAKSEKEDVRRLVSIAQERLQDPYYTSPFACADPWLAGQKNVIVTLEDWARDKGLKRGDRLVKIGESELEPTLEWDEAMRKLPPSKPFSIAVERDGREYHLVLECRDHAPYLNAEREVFQAMSQQNWTKCVSAADQAMEIFGSKTTPLLAVQMLCLQQMSPTNDAVANLRYQKALTAIDELPFEESAARTELRTQAVEEMSRLRQEGYQTFAEDLQTQLSAADTEMRSRR